MQFRQDSPIVEFSQMLWLLSNREKETCQECSPFVTSCLKILQARRFTLSRNTAIGARAPGFIIMIQVYIYLVYPPFPTRFSPADNRALCRTAGLPTPPSRSATTPFTFSTTSVRVFDALAAALFTRRQRKLQMQPASITETEGCVVQSAVKNQVESA